MNRQSRRTAVVLAGVLSAAIGVASPAHAEEINAPYPQIENDQIDISDFAEDNESDQKALAQELAQLSDQQEERDRMIAELRETEESGQANSELDVAEASPAEEPGFRTHSEEPEAHVVTGLHAVDVGSGSSGISDGVFAPAVPKPVYFLNNPLGYMYVTSNYGSRYHPTLHYTRLHAGTDLRAPCGTAVLAAQSGIVLSAKWNGTGGNTILIDHGTNGEHNIKTRYLHLSKMQVQTGQAVSMGEQIGLSGMTGGISTGCHLHFEVLIDDETVDPLTQLQYELPAPFVAYNPLNPTDSIDVKAPMPAVPIGPSDFNDTDEVGNIGEVGDPIDEVGDIGEVIDPIDEAEPVADVIDAAAGEAEDVASEVEEGADATEGAARDAGPEAPGVEPEVQNEPDAAGLVAEPVATPTDDETAEG